MGLQIVLGVMVFHPPSKRYRFVLLYHKIHGNARERLEDFAQFNGETREGRGGGGEMQI